MSKPFSKLKAWIFAAIEAPRRLANVGLLLETQVRIADEVKGLLRRLVAVAEHPLVEYEVLDAEESAGGDLITVAKETLVATRAMHNNLAASINLGRNEMIRRVDRLVELSGAQSKLIVAGIEEITGVSPKQSCPSLADVVAVESQIADKLGVLVDNADEALILLRLRQSGPLPGVDRRALPRDGDKP